MPLFTTRGAAASPSPSPTPSPAIDLSQEAYPDAPTSDAPGTARGAASDATPTPAATVTGPDGRQYTPAYDAATGHTTYTHHSKQAGADGVTAALDIVIDIAPDGSFARSVHQHITDTAGNFRDQTEVTSHDAAGVQIGDVVDAVVHLDGAEQTEHTVSSFTKGVETGRVSDITKTQHEAAPGKTVDSHIAVHAVWDAAGGPITDATKPQLDRTDTATYVEDGEGINKDTPRTLKTTMHYTGTPDALVPDDHMNVVVRFDGHGSQYIERELSVPLDAQGAPDFAHATSVREEDHQSTTVKALTQARVWGGFASSLLGIVGARLIGGSGSTLGKGFMVAGLAAGGAELVGESHALATRRNDGSWAREIMSVYDNATMLALAAYLHGHGGDAAASTSRTGAGVLTAAFGAGAATHAGVLGAGMVSNRSTSVSSLVDSASVEQTIGTAAVAAATADPMLRSLGAALPARA